MEKAKSDETLDPRTIFPKTKIKKMLRQNETLPRISAKATDFIAACSAVFVQQLAAIASSDVNDDGMVDAECVELCVEGDSKYEFLEDVLDEFAERREAAGATHGSAAGKKAANLTTRNSKSKKPGATAKGKAAVKKGTIVAKACIGKKKTSATPPRSGAVKMNDEVIVSAISAVTDGPVSKDDDEYEEDDDDYD